MFPRVGCKPDLNSGVRRNGHRIEKSEYGIDNPTSAFAAVAQLRLLERNNQWDKRLSDSVAIPDTKTTTASRSSHTIICAAAGAPALTSRTLAPRTIWIARAINCAHLPNTAFRGRYTLRTRFVEMTCTRCIACDFHASSTGVALTFSSARRSAYAARLS